jgi:hypothetical protein
VASGAGDGDAAMRASSAFKAIALRLYQRPSADPSRAHLLRSASARAPPGPGSIAYELAAASSHGLTTLARTARLKTRLATTPMYGLRFQFECVVHADEDD